MYRADKEESTATVKGYKEGAKRDVVAFVDASVERIVNDASATTKAAREGLSKKEQIDGTKERRAAEKEANSPAGERQPSRPDTGDDDLSPNRAVWDQANKQKTA